MGGDASHEFISPSPSGEDVVVTCPKCKYAANREKAECLAPLAHFSGKETKELLPREEVSTPGLTTVEEVAAFLKTIPKNLIKTLIFTNGDTAVAALLRGDHELNESKLERAAGMGSLEMATPEKIQEVTGGPVGFSGPVGLKLKLIADHSIPALANVVTGANKKDTHFTSPSPSRRLRTSSARR